MASQRASNGYNNPAYCNQYDYDQLTRHSSPRIMNHGNQTYISASAVDNYCYEDDEEIQLSTIVHRQQTRQMVRQPPIGASTTLRITESRFDNISPRKPTIRMSPKRNHQNVKSMISPESVHRNDTTVTSPVTPKKNYSVIMTSTPRKPHILASKSPGRAEIFPPRRQQECTRNATPVSPVSSARKTTLPTSPAKPSVRNMKYELTPQTSTRPRRNTAVIPPMYACTDTSVISSPSKHEPFLCRKSQTRTDTSPGLKVSWIHIPESNQAPPTGTVMMAGATLLVCGAVTIALCLYMMFKNGRRYYLDFGVMSGFGSVLLGCLGFRSRRWQWLPNRNYLSGYVILSTFSLLTCAGLIAIMTLQPKPGEPLTDLAGGAVCGIAVLSFILAALGVLLSRCCKYPPPDNRVEHCAEGFTL